MKRSTKKALDIITAWSIHEAGAAAKIDDFIMQATGRDVVVYDEATLKKSIDRLTAIKNELKREAKENGEKWTGSPRHELVRKFDSVVRTRIKRNFHKPKPEQDDGVDRASDGAIPSTVTPRQLEGAYDHLIEQIKRAVKEYQAIDPSSKFRAIVDSVVAELKHDKAYKG